LFCFGARSVLAVDFFEEEFDAYSLNSDLWTLELNDGLVIFTGSEILLESSKISFPFVYSNDDIDVIPPEGDFNLKIRFKYPVVSYMGDGLGVGFVKTDGSTLIEFGFWQDLTNDFLILFNDFSKQGGCSDLESFSDASGRVNLKVLEVNTDWHIFELERFDNIFSVYLDRNINNDSLFDLVDNGCFPKKLFFGNHTTGGSFTWSSLLVDSIKVERLKDIETVVVVPGLGGSWNGEALLTGSTSPALEWKMPFFVKNYDGLISTLKANGYKDETMAGTGETADLFVWNYDWRRPVSEIIERFDDFVNEKIPVEENFTIVGHSLGGMVGRMWAQDNNDDTRLDKVISLGSPHFGVIKAYNAWNGAEFGEGVSSVALNVLLQLHKKNFTTSTVELVQNFSPSLKDILPVFDFVKYGYNLVPYQDLFAVNNYAVNKNNDIFDISDTLLTVGGIGFDTSEYVVLGERSTFDKLLGRWIDGRPLRYENTLFGDKTVLQKSAVVDGFGQNLILSDHGNIVDNSIPYILNELGIGTSSLTISDVLDLSDSLVFYIGSPAYLRVFCGADEAKESDETGFVVVENRGDINGCGVNVVPLGAGGEYHLVTGNSGNEDGWRYFEDNISIGETKFYFFDVEGKEMFLGFWDDPIYDLIKKDCNLLLNQYPADEDLLACVVFAEGEDSNSLSDVIFSFRKRNKEMTVSLGLVENLKDIFYTELLGGVTYGEADEKLRQMKIEKSLIDRVTRLKEARGQQPDGFGAASYKWAGILLEEMKQNYFGGDYEAVVSKGMIMGKLLREVW